MIWAIIGIVIAIILGCTAIFFHQKQRKHSWIPAVLAVLALAGSGIYARHEIISNNNKPRTTQQAKRRPAKVNKNKVNNKKPQKQQNNKSANKNQKQTSQKKSAKPVNNKWKLLKRKVAKIIVIAAIMALIAGAILDG